MGRPCSLGLWERICAYVSRGHAARAAARVFGVTAATAVRLGVDPKTKNDHTVPTATKPRSHRRIRGYRQPLILNKAGKLSPRTAEALGPDHATLHYHSTSPTRGGHSNSNFIE
jgi:hypothetical protein